MLNWFVFFLCFVFSVAGRMWPYLVVVGFGLHFVNPNRVELVYRGSRCGLSQRKKSRLKKLEWKIFTEVNKNLKRKFKSKNHSKSRMKNWLPKIKNEKYQMRNLEWKLLNKKLEWYIKWKCHIRLMRIRYMEKTKKNHNPWITWRSE